MGRNLRNVEFLNQLRELTGHTTVSAFAHAAGLSPQNASAYLNGTKTPQSKALSRILRNLYGGAHPNVIFFRILEQLSGINNRAAFATACGQKRQNTSAYLRGSKIPKKRVLLKSLVALFGWRVTMLAEIAPLPSTIGQLPKKPGVYVLYDSGLNVVYIGKATFFHREVQQTLRRRIPVSLRSGVQLKKNRPILGSIVTMHSLYQIDDPTIRNKFESLLLRVFSNQTYNSNVGTI
jgi:hypothetical protein